MSKHKQFKIETSGIGQTQGTLLITDQQISFAGRQINIRDIFSVSTALSQRSEVLYTTINAKIVLFVGSRPMVIKFSSSNFLRIGNMHEVLQKYIEVRNAIVGAVGPHVLQKYITQICNGSDVWIGGLRFDMRGITGRSLLGGEVCAAWNSNPEVRFSSKGSCFTRLTKGEHLEIVFHSQATGKIIKIGSMSYRDDNACFVPHLIAAMTERV